MIPGDVRPIIHQGDCLDLLKRLPEGVFHTCVTSPPYWRMRDYGVDGQDGLEDTVEEFVARQVAVFREVRRVLRKDGTAWVNIGDTYVGGGKGARSGPNSTMGDQNAASAGVPVVKPTRPDDRVGAWTGDWQADPRRRGTLSGNLKRKDLALVPFRLAIALQDDGWWVREAIIWSKPNGIPEPARGRPVHAHEYILLLAKSEAYFYDGFAVRQPMAEATVKRYEQAVRSGYEFDPERHKSNYGQGQASPVAILVRSAKAYDGSEGANLRSVWTIPMEPFTGDHFAPYPTEIPRRAIKAGTSAKGACAACGTPWHRKIVASGGAVGNGNWWPKDAHLTSGRLAWNEEVHKAASDGTYVQREAGWEPGCSCGADVVPCLVLDPYSGSGTTLQVARELGRRSVGLELNPKYVEIARRRSTADTPDLTSWEAPA